MNDSKVKLIHLKVDKCLISADDERRRCDHAVELGDTVFLVEIKGKRIMDAVEQIISTLENCGIGKGKAKILPVIAATQCPSGTALEPARKRLKAAFGERLLTPLIRTRVVNIEV